MKAFLHRVAAMACCGLLSPIAPLQANTHPEDAFCAPDRGMDPALCRDLARLDTQNATPEKPAPDA